MALDLLFDMVMCISITGCFVLLGYGVWLCADPDPVRKRERDPGASPPKNARVPPRTTSPSN